MKKYVSILSLGFIMIFSCCRVFRSDDFVTYNISRGKQMSHTKVTVFSGKELKFIAKFDESAIYSTCDSVNQQDINKLYGFSDCSSSHHTNSARFGWRWYHHQIEIFAYCYHHGVRDFKYITSVNVNQEYEYVIRIEESNYVFSVNGVTVSMSRGCSGRGFKYYLFPYFGGNEKAPHKIKIRIKDL